MIQDILNTERATFRLKTSPIAKIDADASEMEKFVVTNLLLSGEFPHLLNTSTKKQITYSEEHNDDTIVPTKQIDNFFQVGENKSESYGHLRRYCFSRLKQLYSEHFVSSPQFSNLIRDLNYTVFEVRLLKIADIISEHCTSSLNCITDNPFDNGETSD